MACGCQCYNASQKLLGFNDVFLPICKGFKYVMQFVTLFQINREKIESIESYFCIIDAYKPIDLMQLVVNQIFCDEIFGVINDLALQNLAQMYSFKLSTIS